ncbi:hypothetical protein BCR35DRAFT_62151 [Leucosporidium creatinivorum]|uniref:Uncharacterized protein n=1 Tax=Leucosporidium creatinivorum TaxID=106004 RepID=A0A1Y2FLR1_9BASI|nr:hypothetical protein BCR35DRAFT_62151 [Leucosporidium creatinivorum]
MSPTTTTTGAFLNWSVYERRRRKRQIRSLLASWSAGNARWPYEAETTSLAATEPKTSNANPSSASSHIRERIKKMLALSKHDGTPEAEMFAAFTQATRLMSKYNVTEASLTETEGAELARGVSLVTVRPNYPITRVKDQQWSCTLASAIAKAFSIKTYTSTFAGGSKLEVAFYGIAMNTTTAATTFEMAFNLILSWSERKKRDRLLVGRAAITSYREGIAAGVRAAAEQIEKEVEAATALREAEEVERRTAEDKAAAEAIAAQKARLQPLPSPPKEPIILPYPFPHDAVSPKPPFPPKPSSPKPPAPKLSSPSPSPPPPLPLPSNSSGFDDDQVQPSFYRPLSDNAASDSSSDLPDLSQSSSDDDGTQVDAEEEEDYSDQEDYGGEEEELDDDEEAEVEEKSTGKEDVEQPVQPIASAERPTSGVGASQPSQTAVLTSAQEEDTSGLAFPSTQHLILFRANAMDIADKALSETGVKLCKGRAFVGKAWDWNAYKQGKEDAKKIDLRGKRIKETEDSDDESAPRKKAKGTRV